MMEKELLSRLDALANVAAKIGGEAWRISVQYEWVCGIVSLISGLFVCCVFCVAAYKFAKLAHEPGDEPFYIPAFALLLFAAVTFAFAMAQGLVPVLCPEGAALKGLLP